MYLTTLLAFLILFWQAEQPGQWLLVSAQDVFWTLLIVVLQPCLFGALAWWAARRSQRLLVRHASTPQVAQRFHHRSTMFLRIAVLLGFALTTLGTPWPTWFAFGRTAPPLQIIGDLIVLSPFLASIITVWLAAYPLERDLRSHSLGSLAGGEEAPGEGWRLRSYLDFNVRHQFLIVAVPMTLTLFAANLTRGYQGALRGWTGCVWAPDALLGVVALAVFFLSPLLLCRIWHTHPLEAGPVRERLEKISRRIGLRFRDILVWKSNGMMINAAVMGLFAPVRFVLLSDGLLGTMDMRQIEAVFGHEAGHVRHRHIQHFLVFALVGWLLVAGLMELFARTLSYAGSSVPLSPVSVQGIGVAAAILFWGLGFGWLSRRFEREADLFGARCVTPAEDGCRLPCSVHTEDAGVRSGRGRLCATGATIFASALDRVAVLNGVPHEERSWRHSSIGSRIRFLASMAGDPNRAARFERLVRRVKIAMLAVAIIGSAASVYYWLEVAQPALFRS